jgi:serine/threonine protein phosphatase PrpC
MKDLLPIGEFAARSGLSARVLRGYAAAGLLEPAAVDGQSGYRYYAPGQLRLARLILLLRRARVPLSEIAVFIRHPDPGTLRRWEGELDLEARNRRQALTEAGHHLGLAACGRARHEGDDAMTMQTAGSATDPGTARTTNQDALLISPPLFAVADGLGQSPGGETASRLALDTLSAAFTGTPAAEALAAAFRQASQAVWERASTDPSLHGMGTTLTAVAVLQTGPQTRLAVASIGDSRAYLFQDGQLRQLTRDHSVVQGLIDAGQVTADQWRSHPDRSLLTRALGIAPVVEPDITLPEVTGNARLLLCTDGLTAQAEDPEITAILSGPGDPGQVASNLIELANNNGGADNTAVIVIDI